jgi:hypothetical protein
MKNDGNDEYYAIMSQAIPNLYGGDVLSPQNKISEEVMNIFKILKKLVLKFNETHYYNQFVFDFIQPLANKYNKIIVSIDYRNNSIQINIPFVDNSTVYPFDIIPSLYIDDLAQSNGYNYSNFQDILRNLGFTFKSNLLMLFALHKFLSDKGVIALSYSFDGVKGDYLALQPKPLKLVVPLLLNNNNDNNNNYRNVKINISEYL